MKVIQFPSSLQPVGSRDCPSWCAADGEHDFHAGELRALLERDEDQDVIYALGGRVQSMFPSQRPLVEVVVWEQEGGVVVTEGRHLLTPIEVREAAGYLLRLADEAEGVNSGAS